MTTKQEQLHRIVNEEIRCAYVTRTVEALQSAYPDEVEDIENLYTHNCPHCAEDVSRIDFAASEDHADYCYTCPKCEKPFDDAIEDQQEVASWHIVSQWLYEQLTAMGEVTWAPHDVYYWGRCGGNYALEDEGCLIEVAEAIAEPEAMAS